MVVDLLSLGISFGELASKATNVRYQSCNSTLWALSLCFALSQSSLRQLLQILGAS